MLLVNIMTPRSPSLASSFIKIIRYVGFSFLLLPAFNWTWRSLVEGGKGLRYQIYKEQKRKNQSIVTRLGIFGAFSYKRLSAFWAILKSITFSVKTAVCTFGVTFKKTLATLNYNIWSHYPNDSLGKRM